MNQCILAMCIPVYICREIFKRENFCKLLPMKQAWKILIYLLAGLQLSIHIGENKLAHCASFTKIFPHTYAMRAHIWCSCKKRLSTCACTMPPCITWNFN